MSRPKYLAAALLLTLGSWQTSNAQSSQSWSPDSTVLKTLSFRNVGPTRGGRVTAVSGVTEEPGTFYMGSTGGGVWKTTDYGITWNNISDGYFSSPSIGAINVYQKNPDILYVGTGTDGIRSNVIAGKGVYKSEDAGKSWSFIGLKEAGLIGALEIHPDDPNKVYVAAIGQPFGPNQERGVFRTTDGGQNWEKVLYHSDTVGAVDLEFAPDNPDIIYAAMWRTQRKPWTIISGSDGEGGIYKSTDGGDSWNKVKGLPEGLIGKIDLAVSKADPNRVYALVEAPGDKGGLYRSDDHGENFSWVSNQDGLLDRPFYYCNIEANPLDADIVYGMATRYWKSTDAGKSWENVSTPHGDNHDMWFNEKDTAVYIQANDGGANITTNGGQTWSSQHNQPTAELYQVEVDDQYPYWLYAGQQDNTTIAVPSLPPYDAPSGPEGFWMEVGGCETGPAVPKPGNPDIVCSNCKGRFGVFDKNTGQEKQYYVGAQFIYGHNPKDLKFRFQRVSPIMVSKHNPDNVYFGSQFLHKTTDDGSSWETISEDLTANKPSTQVVSGSPITRDVTGEEYYSTLYEISESPVKEGVIYTGANDGPIHVTQDGGESWKEITPEGLPEGGRVDCIDPSPHQEGKAYAAILRNQMDDWHPYIYKTEDFGASWTLLTPGDNGIPENMPTRVIREDPDVEGLLYAGTEYGLYISYNDGETWQSFQQNLPITPITDIKVFRKDLILSTMGRSFWIMDDLSPIHAMLQKDQPEETALFTPEKGIRYHYRGSRGNSVPQYPDPTLNLDFYLGDQPAGPVTLTIVDQKGDTVRSFTSTVSKGEKQEEGTDMATGFTFGGSEPSLDAKQGLNRFEWDMQHRGPWDKKESSRYNRGPLVSPGNYKAILTVDGKDMEQSFEVMSDPQVTAAGVTVEDMQAQEKLVMEIVKLESMAKKAAALIHSKTDEKSPSKGLSKKEKSRLKVIQEKLVTADGSYMQPMLIDQVSYLRSMLERADQRPGKDAYERFNELMEQWKEIENDLSSYDLDAIEMGDD